MDRHDEWAALLRPAVKRMRHAAALRIGLLSLLAGAGAACLVLAAGRLWPIAGIRVTAALVLAGVLLAGAVLLSLQRISPEAAAALLDRCGLEDRLTTALRFRSDPSALAALQRRDAAERLTAWLDGGGLSAALPMQPKRRVWLPAAGLAALFVLLLALPNGQDAVLARRQMDQAWIEQQRETAAHMAASLAALPSPPPAVQSMAAGLSRLERELAASSAVPQALDRLEEALQRMDQSLRQLDQQQLQARQWAESWQRTEALRGAGQALARGDAAAVRRELGGVADAAASMTPQQQQQLADELLRLAASAETAAPDQAAALAGGLTQAAAALRGGDPGSASQALQGVAAELGDAAASQLALAQQQAVAAQQAAELAAAAQALAQGASGETWAPDGLAAQLAAGAGAGAAPQAVAGAGSQPGTGAGSQPGTGAGSQSGTGAGSQPGTGAGSQSGTGAGSQPGTGAGSQPGTGAGSQSGTGAGSQPGSGAGSQPGSGAGSQPGTGAGSQPGTGAGSQGGIGTGTAGTGAGTGAGSRGLVATPRERTGGGAGATVDSGALGSGSGGTSAPSGSAPGIEGGSRPYEDVYADYADEASSSLSRSELPQNVQNLVRDYFLQIQPQR